MSSVSLHRWTGFLSRHTVRGWILARSRQMGGRYIDPLPPGPPPPKLSPSSQRPPFVSPPPLRPVIPSSYRSLDPPLHPPPPTSLRPITCLGPRFSHPYPLNSPPCQNAPSNRISFAPFPGRSGGCSPVHRASFTTRPLLQGPLYLDHRQEHHPTPPPQPPTPPALPLPWYQQRHHRCHLPPPSRACPGAP